MLKYCNRDFYETLVKMKSFVHSDQECFTQRHSGWICSEMSKCPLPAQNRNGDSAMNQTRKNSAKPDLLSKLEPAIRHRPVMVTFFVKMVLFVSWAASRKRATYLWQYGRKFGDRQIPIYVQFEKQNYKLNSIKNHSSYIAVITSFLSVFFPVRLLKT